MKTKIALLVIVLIGIYLRFTHLTTVPPSLSHDEVAIAYNAYSILKTGKDEYGKPFPILFRSFDDYKLPGMVYATIPAVALFGRTELAARLPSAIFGVLAIIVMYGIAVELLGKKMALFPTLMFSLQPWHINFSRQLFESNGAVFWFMLGTYFLLRSRHNYKNIFWTGIFYVTSLYFYYSVRLVIPFVLLLYAVMYWKTVTQKWKITLLTAGICFLVFLPLGKEMLSPGGLERISIVSVTNDPTYHSRRDAYIKIIDQHPSLINKILYNRRVALAQTVAENYWKNISPHNLFVTGTGTYGALYPFEAMLLIFGIIMLLSLPRFSLLITLVWLVTAFLPGALSVNQPNTLRTLIAAPMLALLSGLGLYGVYNLLTKNSLHPTIQFFLIMICSTIVIHEVPTFHYAYFENNAKNNAINFGDGYRQMITYVKTHESKYDAVVISGYYWRPYIFMLYWGNIDPVKYQNGGDREKFGNYIFTAADWDTNGTKLMDPLFDLSSLPGDDRTLYILSPPEYEALQKHVAFIEEINGRHAQKVFIAAKQQ